LPRKSAAPQQSQSELCSVFGLRDLCVAALFDLMLQRTARVGSSEQFLLKTKQLKDEK